MSRQLRIILVHTWPRKPQSQGMRVPLRDGRTVRALLFGGLRGTDRPRPLRKLGSLSAPRGRYFKAHAATPYLCFRRASSGRHLLARGLHLGQAAWSLYLPQREAAPHQRHGARRAHAALPRLETRLRCLSSEVEVLHQGRGAQDPARSSRGCPRCGSPEDEDEGVRQVA